MVDHATVRRLAELVGWSGPRDTLDWPDLEERLGIGLPDDFKVLVETFPYGEFQDLLRLAHPRWLADNAKWASWLRSWGVMMEQAREREPALCRYEYFPQPGGLLPWAEINDDEFFCWLTDGPPDTWRVVVCDTLDVTDPYPMAAAEFLEALVTGRVTVPFFSEDFLDELARSPVTFTPIGSC